MSVAKKIFESFTCALLLPRPHAGARLDGRSRRLPDGRPVDRGVMLGPGRLAREVVGPLASQPGKVEANEGCWQACRDRRDLLVHAGCERHVQLAADRPAEWSLVAEHHRPRTHEPEFGENLLAAVVPGAARIDQHDWVAWRCHEVLFVRPLFEAGRDAEALRSLDEFRGPEPGGRLV